MSDAAVRRLTVICTMSCKEALIELVPVFEHERGYSVDVVYGAGAGLARKIADGLRGDVFVGPEEFSGQLIEQGVLDGNSRSAFANSGAVIAVKAGTPIPDIGTAEKLRDVLLAAKGVSYSTGASAARRRSACSSPPSCCPSPGSSSWVTCRPRCDRRSSTGRRPSRIP
jgi:molybdate transport system substrate-binding protein